MEKKKPNDPLDMSDLTQNYLKCVNQAIEQNRQECDERSKKMYDKPKKGKFIIILQWFKLKS